MSCSRLFHSNIAHDDQGNLYRTWEKRPATADSSPKTNRSRYAGRLAADCSAASHKRAADRADQLENNIWGNVDNLIESQGPVQQRDSNPDASVVAHNASVTGCHRSYTLRQMLRQPMPGATQKGGASRSAKQADYVVDNITAHDHRPPVEAIGGLGGPRPMPVPPNGYRPWSPKSGTLPPPVSTEGERSGFVGHSKRKVYTSKASDPLCSQHLAPAYRQIDDSDIHRRARRKAKECTDADDIRVRRMAEDPRQSLLMWSGPESKEELAATTRAEMKRTVNITGAPKNPDRRRNPGDPRPEKPVRAPKYDPREAKRRPPPVARQSAKKEATAPEP